MTGVHVSLVDVYVIRASGPGMDFLVLRRGPGGRCPGSWETVHGHIDPGERPGAAARRELAEETGLVPERLYNLSRVESFYDHSRDEVALVPVFVAWVGSEAEVTLSAEHDRVEWLSPERAKGRFAWPRERRAVGDIVVLFGGGGGGGGDAGAVDDVLRVE